MAKKKEDKTTCRECKLWLESKEVEGVGTCSRYSMITDESETCQEPKRKKELKVELQEV